LVSPQRELNVRGYSVLFGLLAKHTTLVLTSMFCLVKFDYGGFVSILCYCTVY